MRVIPVIDLLHGQVVHAVKGRRENYQPVKSVLCASCDPLEVAASFRNLLSLNEIYIADLDAIRDPHKFHHRKIIADTAHRLGMDIMLDAGASNANDICKLIEIGVCKAVIGSETLQTLDAVQDIPSRINRRHLVFSLDLQAGRILSRCADLRAMAPIEAVKYLQSSGWQEIILLNLERVGGGEGIDTSLATEVLARMPDLRLILGGGISDPKEFSTLKLLGISGVLTASALHRGTITARHLASGCSENTVASRQSPVSSKPRRPRRPPRNRKSLRS